MNLGATELIIVLVILLVLFGGAKLPKLARSLGRAQKEFKEGVTEGSKAGEQPKEQSSGNAGDQPKDS